MLKEIAFGAVAFLICAAVSFLFYRFAKKAVAAEPKKFVAYTSWRLCMSALVFGCVCMGSRFITDSPFGLMIGAALGLTLPSFYFTKKLLELNSTLAAEKDEPESVCAAAEDVPEKEDAPNG